MMKREESCRGLVDETVDTRMRGPRFKSVVAESECTFLYSGTLL